MIKHVKFISIRKILSSYFVYRYGITNFWKKITGVFLEIKKATMQIGNKDLMVVCNRLRLLPTLSAQNKAISTTVNSNPFSYLEHSLNLLILKF